MSPEERLVVLESLLAKVRQTAHDRGIGLPQDLPPGIWRDRVDSRRSRVESPIANVEVEVESPIADALLEVAAQAEPSPETPRKPPGRLTAFSETGAGNHAPLALVDAPTNVVVRAPLPTLVETAEDEPVPSAPLIEFSPAFEDEPTQNADSAEAERKMLEEIDAAEREDRAPLSKVVVETPLSPPPPPPPPAAVIAPAPPPASVIAAPPPPPPAVARISSIPAATPARASNVPPKRTSYVPRPTIPIELEDLDDLAIPQPVVPKAPGAPSLSALERAFASQPPSLPRRDSRPPSAAPPPATAKPFSAPLPPPPPRVPAPLAPPPATPAPAPPARAPAPPPPAPLTPPPTPPPPTPPPPTARPSSSVPPPPPVVVAPARVPTPVPAPLEDAEPATVLASAASLDREEEAPESQRQKVVDARPVDDALDGVREEEQPPESGEVESQRYASHSREAMESEPSDAVDVHLPNSIRIEDDAPTPRPIVHDVTAEVRSLGDVDVVERAVVPPAAVATFRGAVPNARPSFGEILDLALGLASLPED